MSEPFLCTVNEMQQYKLDLNRIRLMPFVSSCIGDAKSGVRLIVDLSQHRTLKAAEKISLQFLL